MIEVMNHCKALFPSPWKVQIKIYLYYYNQGRESSDFDLISDFFALHKTPFLDF